MSDDTYKYKIKPYLIGSYPHEPSVHPVTKKPVDADPRWALNRYRRVDNGQYVLSGRTIFSDYQEAVEARQAAESENYAYPTGFIPAHERNKSPASSGVMLNNLTPQIGDK